MGGSLLAVAVVADSLLAVAVVGDSQAQGTVCVWGGGFN